MQGVRFVLFSMDKEILYINNILKESDNGLSTSEISKTLYEKHGIKVSRKIVKNYLWSYFRSIINYDSSKYTYTLESDQFLLEDVNVRPIENTPRALSIELDGNKMIINYNKNRPIEDYIKALAILNIKSSKKKSNADLLKQLNRIIEKLDILNDYD